MKDFWVTVEIDVLYILDRELEDNERKAWLLQGRLDHRSHRS
jgi:hypothetical protein